MGHLRRTYNYSERIVFSDRTNIMSMVDLLAISVETPKIGSKCSLEKEFT